MGITYDERNMSFKIDTGKVSYCMAVADGYLGHSYFGKRIADDASQLLRVKENPYTPDSNARDKLCFMDCFPMEYPTHGTGDFRGDAFKLRTSEGYRVCELRYVSHEILKNKKKLKGLPATFGDKAESLVIKLADDIAGIEAELSYSIFDDNDAVIRSVTVKNVSDKELYLERVLSAAFDMDNREYSLITLNGTWARERHIDISPIGKGFHGVSSNRGETSHQHQPFIGIASKNISQESGEVYGVHLIYSGNFQVTVYNGQFDNLRVMAGIGEDDFEWKLSPGEEFTAPEAVLVYSSEGLGGMSRTFHDLYRDHLIRGKYRDLPRPVLINNWEATYFDFDDDKLVSIAAQAAKSGIEMLVMDDGWFGNRFDDNRALGDWTVNEDKLKGGLKKLVERVNALGLKFGIWFEPEMVSPDSELYRAHPDWAIAVPGRTAGLCRNQYVLDITRKEVRDYVFDAVSSVLDSANVEYVKWDMNRQLADLGSMELPADRQGELSHRYVLAVYELQERLISRYPELLLENCSGGGARFDPGMLYYSPQIWCSDDTDAIERLSIQEGTALIYPLSAMGAHVSDCPNHTVGRVTPFETRGYVALAGTFGYELDITKIPEADRKMIPAQIAMYHSYHELVAKGDYYRIGSYNTNRMWDAWMCVSKDKQEALLTFIQVMGRANYHSRIVRLSGLDPDKTYRLKRFDTESAEEKDFCETAFRGDTLMNAGLVIPAMNGDFRGLLIHLVTEG
ncbi:MAG: alpha-galactosidase [Lachnospiraceae bacterium]|nr:alpha-galactosidase [Lachnospiraceae bacterium]